MRFKLSSALIQWEVTIALYGLWAFKTYMYMYIDPYMYSDPLRTDLYHFYWYTM